MKKPRSDDALKRALIQPIESAIRAGIERLQGQFRDPGQMVPAKLPPPATAKAPNKKQEGDVVRRDNDGLHRRRGVWYFCLTVDGKRKFFSTGTKDYKQAKLKKSEAEEDQRKNQLPPDLAKAPFEKALALICEERKQGISENSARIDRERSGPLLKHFSGRRVSTLANKSVIRAYQSARAKQVGPRTINMECKLLRQVLQAAKVWRLVADDFKPLPENRRGPGRALDETQERILFETARSRTGSEWDAVFYAGMVAANTTMRSVEIKSLLIANVNLIDAEVMVERSKTDTGRRRIPLNGAALWAFARLLERAQALGATEQEHFLMPAFRYRLTKAEKRGTGYDVTRPMKTWRTAWRSLVREASRRAGRQAAREAICEGKGWRAGLAAWKRAARPFDGLRFHDLRHLAITKLAESEASDQTIMAIAGHMDRSMLEHYSHIRAAAKRKAVDGIRSFIPEEKPAISTPGRVQ